MKLHNTLILFVLLLCSSIVDAQNPEQKQSSSSAFDFPCPPPLKLKYFANTTPYKDWKIIFGKPFSYKATPGSGSSWDWDLGDNASGTFAPFWQDNQFNPPLNNQQGTSVLPVSEIPIDNSELGSTNGTIRIQSNIGGSIETILSGPSEEVEVFFEKNNMNHHDNTVPNWYYYWIQAPEIYNELSLDGVKLFNSTTCSFDANPTPVDMTLLYDGSTPFNPTGLNTYGSSSYQVLNWDLFDYYDCDPASPPRLLAISYVNGGNDSRRIRIGDGCGYFSSVPGTTGVNLEGIHVLFSTVMHEMEHAKINNEQWVEGYDSNHDMDKDYYRDLWELYEAPVTTYYQFDIEEDDAYDSNYDPNLLGLGLYSAGTEYEEERCRNVEAELYNSGNINNINPRDWSHDSTPSPNTIQGKNW